MFERNSFALACFTALAGVASAVGAVGAVGCSSDTTNGASEVGSDAGGGNKGGVPSGMGDPDTCAKTEKVDVSGLPFKPPRVVPGACSDEDRAFFSSTVQLKVSISQVEQLVKQRNPECAACIFGTDGDTWAPIVAMGNDEYVQNVGGCFAVVSGKASCGKAFHAVNTCVETACGACSESEIQACTAEARDEGGACNEPSNEYLVECGPDPEAIARTCLIGTYAVDGSILHQCGGAKADGGT